MGYYDAAASLRRETDDGVWLFMPKHGNSHGLDTQADCSALHGASNNRGFSNPSAPMWSTKYRPPHDDPDHHGHERAESEAATFDPSVDPDEPPQMRRRNRRSRRSRGSNSDVGRGQDVPEARPTLPSDAFLAQGPAGEVIESDVADPVHHVSKSSDASWNSRMGPEKGVKYRSGMPPQPPAWRYNREDLRSFVKWERKLSVWQLQIQSYMNRREAALLLFTSLSGEAEEELENCDLAKVNSATGIEYIQEQLRQGLQTKLVYQKRKLLADHESIVRQNNESIRAFANRYRRTERALTSVGVNVEGMYDDESRGNRLLERSRLSPENQRLALIGSRYSLNFDAILESLCMSFPEHKHAPPLFGKDGTPIRSLTSKPSSFSSSSSSSSLATTSTASTYRSDKGNGKGKFKPRQAFATEATELEAVPEDGEEQQDDGDENYEPDDNAEDGIGDDAEDPDQEQDEPEVDFGEVAEVLTVTAKKLQALTLGRKFSGNRHVADRKKNTHCAACGELGHWAGDATCSKSAKGGNKGKSKGSSSTFSDGAKNVPSKKVLFTMSHDDGAVQHQLPKEPPETPPFFTFMIDSNAVFHDVMFAGGSMAGLMVFDTACQRTVCGREWMTQHAQALQDVRLQPHSVSCAEAFQFGHGQPITARSRVYFPSVIGDVYMLLGASVVDTPIPLLASNTLLETLDAVIDIGKQQVFFRKIGVTADIIKFQGHLAISISSFDQDSHRLQVWKTLSQERFWKNPHPEIIIPGVTDLEPMKAQSPVPGVFAVEDASATRTSMAEAMAFASPAGAQLGAGGAASYEYDGEIGNGSKVMDDFAGQRCDASSAGADDAHQEGAIGEPVGLSTSGMAKVRKQKRFLQPMPSMPPSAQVEHQPREMGNGWKAFVSKIFFACAILFKYLASTTEIHYEQSQSQTPEIFSNAFDFHYESTVGGWGSDATWCRRDLGGAQSSRFPSTTRSLGGVREGATADHRRWHEGKDAFGQHGLRGDGQPARTMGLGQHGGGPVPMMEKGHKKNLIGKFRKAKHAMEAEMKLYESLATRHRIRRCRVDILETFAGNAPISSRASSFGLIAATPVDYNTGYDLSSQDGQLQCKHMVDYLKPLVLCQSLHCTPWTLLQDNCNYVNRPEELEQRREEERPTVKAAMDRCLDQHAQGRFYLIENPGPSRIWDEEDVLNMLHATGGQIVKCDSGAYGGTNSKGNMIKKTFKFASNNPKLLQFLTKVLTAEERALCVPLEGKEVTLSQHYPYDLVTAILKGIKLVAKENNPTRFAPKQVFANYSMPDADAANWEEVMNQATAIMTMQSAMKNYVLQPEMEIYQDIKQLVPWEITRAQIALQPLVFRHPTQVPYTHRGATIKYVGSETLEVLSEDLSNLHFPRGRFRRAVEIAIFFFGFPNMVDDEVGITGEEARLQAEVEHRPGDTTTEIFHSEIRFPNTAGIDRTIKSSFARMHKNMGHLPGPELIKLLALNGITSDSIIKCIKAMECDACRRSVGPRAPNPASSSGGQTIGQFADNLQADIFYLRDITSKNYPILGICEATHLHAAIRLESRRPDDVLKGFQDAWFRNFGFPLQLNVDDDGCFKGNFHDAMDDAGVFLHFIAPEAHHQIGTIERHNGTLRTILEKIVDSTPCATTDEIDRAVISGVYAKNAATWTSGRPPYIAAFGKIPRVGMDFINDERGLIAGSTTAEAQQQAAMMRCEAMKAIAEASASSTLRRALLRKTNPENILEPTPGSLLAYWRWTTRSHRKRGGYRIARYLGKDPDNRTLWLQSGSQTVRVAHNQVRDVFGYEQFVPTPEDVKALHDAEQNLRQDQWVDHQLPAEVQPPELPQPDDVEFQFPEAPIVVQPEVPLSVPQQPSHLRQQPDLPPPEEQIQQHEPEQTTKTSIRFQQNIQNTQNIFGSQPASPAAAPFTPSRRIPSRKALGRSRTSTRRGIANTEATAQPAETTTQPAQLEDATAAASDPYQQAGGSTAGQQARDLQSHHGTAQQSGSRPASRQNSAPNSIVSRNAMAEPQPTQHAAAEQQQPQRIETVDLTGGDDTPDIGDMVPQTPPAEATASSSQQAMDADSILPSKRPYDALLAGTTQARKVTDTSFELYNYEPTLQPVQKHLHCWARLDIQAKHPQQTMSTGPAMSTVRWRRTIDANTGETITNGTVPTAEQDKQNTYGTARTTITELWHTAQAPQYTFHATDNALEEIEQAWDGSPENYGPSYSSKFFETYVTKLASTVNDFDTTLSESEGEFDDMSKGMPAKTRQEQKADEKELSWRDIMKQSPDYIQGFVEAVQKEAKSFEQWRCLRPIPPEEEQEIMSNPELKKRVINSRGCYRDKNKGVPPLNAKARIVAQGNQDPDLRSLTRQSPTPNRVSEFLVMAIFVSGINQMAFDSALRWKLWIADAATAFLQGAQDMTERAGKLYLRAPRDEIIKRANVFKSMLYEITGNLYGLSNAPVTWAREVVARLRKLGFIMHSFDHMMFYFPDPYNKPYPCAVLICHVDDFMLTYNDNFPFDELLKAFKWGHHQHAEVGKEFTYKGKEFALIQENGQYLLKVTQKVLLKVCKRENFQGA